MADVEITKGGTTVMTGDAIELMRWQCLKSGLEGYAKFGMIPTRGVTITKMLKMAGDVTGKKYKKGDALKAAADVKASMDVLKGSLDIRDK